MSTATSTRASSPARFALGLTVPIVIGAVSASLAGLLAPGTYVAETSNWAGQAIGQDAVNLVIYPAMAVLAWRAARGSSRAYLWWLGAAAYSTYSYLLYAGWVHFSGWFLVYVTTFGASAFALVAGMAALDPVSLRARIHAAAPTRAAGAVLAILGSVFALLWSSEIVPGVLTGEVPRSVVDAGLATNPVWVLDLGLVLPAMVAAGLLLRRDRPVGYLLAGPLLAFGVLMGAAIFGMLTALALRDEPVAVVPLALMAVTVIVEAATIRRLLAPTATIGLPSLLRQPGTSGTPSTQLTGPTPDLTTLGTSSGRSI